MPIYLSHIESWKALWPFPVAALLLTAICFGLVRPKQGRLEWTLLLAAFSMLGLVTGYLTGFSRESAIGAVLPAVLSLMGGLAMFLVGKDIVNRAVISLTVLIFSISLLIGTHWGAILRQSAEDYYTSESFLKWRALIESDVREFREALGLPPEIATPANKKD